MLPFAAHRNFAGWLVLIQVVGFLFVLFLGAMGFLGAEPAARMLLNFLCVGFSCAGAWFVFAVKGLLANAERDWKSTGQDEDFDDSE